MIVVDDDQRENEGDFIAAADRVTPETIAFMITQGRGQLCMPIMPERAQQLEAEGELLAEESVRYERTRIARELHDIVAHCVSVMVVQAYAGERLAAKDDGSASEAFGHIVDAAAQAQLEMRRLVDLLAAEPAADSERGLAAGVGELVAGAVATGLSVNLRIHGDADRRQELGLLCLWQPHSWFWHSTLRHGDLRRANAERPPLLADH